MFFLFWCRVSESNMHTLLDWKVDVSTHKDTRSDNQYLRAWTQKCVTACLCSQILDVCGINVSWLFSCNPLLLYVLTKRYVCLFRLIFENLQLKCRVWSFEASLPGNHPLRIIYTWTHDLQVDYPPPFHHQPTPYFKTRLPYNRVELSFRSCRNW